MNSDPEARELTLTVRHKSEIADGVFLFELRAQDGGELPPFTPGSHITVTAPSGQKRRYSLCNDASERDRYLIAVKRETTGRGGSLSFTGCVNEGDDLAVEPPANEFEMAKAEPKRLIFIAGGIGITPIRPMVLHLHERGRSWELHYACRTRSQAAFADEFAQLRALKLHFDDERGGVLPIASIVAATPASAHLYFCGPEPMRLAFEQAVADRRRSHVHIELFSNPTAVKAQGGSFVVELARSKKSLVIPAGESILEVLRAAGVQVSSSCEQGVCGTCETAVLSGTPDHRDSVLSEHERAAGRTMMICCSGSKSEKLVLDL
jgi:ferredoxin-NADP reductase